MNSSHLVLLCVAVMVVTCWGFNRRKKLSGYKESRCFDSDGRVLLEELDKTHPGLLNAVNYPVLRSSDFSA
jgi:hypothetical protein